MYLQKDKLIVTVGNITLRSYRTAVGPQYLLDVTALAGWTDGVDVKRTAAVRQTSSGDFEEIGYHSSRLITVSGVATADSVQGLHQMRDDLIGALVPEEYNIVNVEDFTGKRMIIASSGGKPSWIQQTDTTATFLFTLYAADPHIYGYPKTVTLHGANSSGGMKFPLQFPMMYGNPTGLQGQFLTNVGNAPAWPVFVIYGDYPEGFTITDNVDSELTYTGPVAQTSPITINSRTGAVTQNGPDRSTFMSKRQWFAIPPGGSIQPSFKPVLSNASGWCDIIYRDTWI